MSEKQLSFDGAMKIVGEQKWIRIKDIERLEKFIQNQQAIIEAKDSLLSILSKENEQLRQVVEEYRKTNKHLSELCADASKNGYLPPLEDLQ